jgi:protein-S-isoprenylcysteine O-methyltransferase Ste14
MYTATFNFFGRQRRISPKHAVAILAFAVPFLIIVYGYMAYLVLETVDHYLGTTKIGAAVLLLVLLGKLTTQDSVYGKKVISLLPEWANALVVNLVPVVTAWFLYQQERQYDCIFVLSVHAVSVIIIIKCVTWVRGYQTRVKEEEREMMAALTPQYFEPTDVPFKEDKK